MDKQTDEIFCTKCGKQINKDFTVCPYCRTEIKKEKEELYDPITATDPQKPKTASVSKSKIITMIIVVVIIAGVIIGFVSCCNSCGTSSKSTSTTESEQSKQIEAFVRSQSVVEKYLKAPSTAKFPYFSDSGVTVSKISENKYKVYAYVDSENSFGAMIRATYSVIITSTGKDTYTYEDIQIND